MKLLALACIFLSTFLSPSLVECASTDAITRAEQTLQGLFHYYWRSDTARKKIQFFFACGQIGLEGDGGQCSCYNPAACVYCYRWWDAVALESVATLGIYTSTKNYSNIANTIFAHSPYNANWNATETCTFIDDFTWYGIAYLRVYEWLKNPVWANRSAALLDWAFENGWDDPCGGFWWSNCDTSLYKYSITILEALHLSSKLAYLFPNESKYLERAKKIWDWFFAFDNGYGLITKQYLVSTGAMPERCCNATINNMTQCHNSKIHGTSYNQGVLMSSAAYLYLHTGNKTYLSVGLRTLDAVLTNYTTNEGTLIDEIRGAQTFTSICSSMSDPGGDWFSFNGIFMLHLSYFTDLLYKNGTLSNATLDRIRAFVEKTSDTTWNKSAVWPPFKNVKDICNLGQPKLTPAIKFPKFHWWWNQDVTAQIPPPPDPKHFYHKSSIRCYTVGADDTQLWEGQVKSELACTVKCRENPQCSKYIYTTVGISNVNCWNWSYNRSDHSCNQSDADFSIGVKRPIGHASCAGKCESNEPQKLDNGGVCYCDEDCAIHLDCCVDYANYCAKSPTDYCKGICGVPQTTPLPGGGYCWCSDNLYSDSRCADLPTQCTAVQRQACLDARSQGSALNLFIAHMKLTQILNEKK